MKEMLFREKHIEINRFEKVKIVSILISLIICVSASAQTFTKVTTFTIPALTNSKTQWIDINNDDRLDLFLTGTTGTGALHTAVYVSNGNNTFNTINLQALSDVAFAFSDYNKDKYIDILLSGITATGTKKTIIYRNDNGNGFTIQNFPLSQIARGGVVWTDFDNDSDPDILITGFNQSNEHSVALYEFANNSYTERHTTLPRVANGAIYSLDANNDGRKEVLITGINTSGNATGAIYTINHDFTISLYSDDIPETAFSSITSGDFNADGFEDILTCGLTQDLSGAATTLLINNGSNGFVSISTNLQNTSSGSVHTADLDHDGTTDVVISGIDDASLKYFKIYRNTGGVFSDVTHSMKNIYNGDASIGDYDNDGDLDLFQTGNGDINFESNLYASDQSTIATNNNPTVPLNLQATVSSGNVSLTWNKANDDLTSQNSISYNVYVSRNANGTDLVLAPLSNLTTGFSKVPQIGNAGYRTTLAINALPEGRYYWSVQSVDNGFRSSAFAPEQSFAICYPINLGADTTICQWEQINLSIGTADDVVNWYSKTDGLITSGSTSLSHQITQNDTIIAELTRPFGCTVKDTIIVYVSLPPTIDLGIDTAVCFGEDFTASIPSAVDSVNWYNMEELLLQNNHTYSYTVLAKDTIIAEVFNAYKCVSYDTVVVDVLPLPQFDIGPETSVCQGEDIMLELPGALGEIDWLNANQLLAANINQYLLHVDGDKTIRARVTDLNNCINYDTIKVTALALPQIALGGDQEICYEQNLTLGLPATSNTINWYTSGNQLLSGNTNSYSFQVLQTQTIVATSTDANNCTGYDSIKVSVLPLPQFNIGNDTAICSHENIILKTGAGFGDVNWYSKSNNTTLLQNSWFYNYTVTRTDTLIAEVFSIDGCVNYDSIRIEELALPVFSLGADKSVCAGDSLEMMIAGNWHTVNWYAPGNIILQQNNNGYKFKVEQSETIRAEVFNNNGCVYYDTTLIHVLPLPEFSLGEDLAYCLGANVRFNPPVTGTNYTWTDGEENVLSHVKDYSFIIEESEIITLTVEDHNLCRYSETIHLGINPLPNFSISGPAEICYGDTLLLSANHNAIKSVEWHDNTSLLSHDATLKIPLLNTTSFTTILTDINNCSSQKIHLVTVNPRPVAEAGRDTLICYGEHVMIGQDYGSQALSFQWSPADFLSDISTGNPMAAPQETTTYTVVVTNNNGCTATDSVYIEVNPQIIAEAGDDTEICIGESVTLGGNPTASGSRFPYSYQWMNDTNSLDGNDPNPIVTPLENTTYYLLVTSGKCEVVYDSIVITVHPLPEIDIISDQSVGAGGNVELFASGGIHYTWLPAETLSDSRIQNPIASPQKTTTYAVVVTDENNCSANGEVTVIVQNQLFIPNLFTPNGDGKNDVFLLYGSGIKELIFSVFDLRGKKVYETRNVTDALNKGWDGAYNGKPLPNDTYVWTIDGQYFNGEPVLFEGKNTGIIKLIK